MSSRPAIEATGPGYHDQGLLRARDLTWKALNEIALRIEPGMLEEDGRKVCLKMLEEAGAEKNWHRPMIRFGANTVKPFGELSAPDTRLGEDDVFFLDIGPVWEGFEGDCGATFVVGIDPEKRRCCDDAKLLHSRVRDVWASQGLTGEALYQFATSEAEKLGWRLALKGANGHRISDFPHAIHHKGSMAQLNFCPSEFRWILEIQIRHPTQNWGAFYEDLLI